MRQAAGRPHLDLLVLLKGTRAMLMIMVTILLTTAGRCVATKQLVEDEAAHQRENFKHKGKEFEDYTDEIGSGRAALPGILSKPNSNKQKQLVADSAEAEHSAHSPSAEGLEEADDRAYGSYAEDSSASSEPPPASFVDREGKRESQGEARERGSGRRRRRRRL